MFHRTVANQFAVYVSTSPAESPHQKALLATSGGDGGSRCLFAGLAVAVSVRDVGPAEVIPLAEVRRSE